MTQLIQVDYAELKKISQALDEGSVLADELLRRIEGQVELLRHGGWYGDAAQRFYAEMDNDVCPGIDRLRSALEEASHVTLRVSDLFSRAEEDAGSKFKDPGLTHRESSNASASSAAAPPAEKAPKQNSGSSGGSTAPKRSGSSGFSNANLNPDPGAGGSGRTTWRGSCAAYVRAVRASYGAGMPSAAHAKDLIAHSQSFNALNNGGDFRDFLKPGDVVVWGAGVQGADGTSGHAAIITEVGEDYVKIAESSWWYSNNGRSPRFDRVLKQNKLSELHIMQ